MAKTWVPNTGTKPQFIGGKLVHPGEGAFVDSPDPSAPVPAQVQAQVNGAGALELVANGVKHRAMTPVQGAAFDSLVSDAGNGRVHSIGLMDDQPLGITRPVRSAGQLVCTFGSGVWLSADAVTNHAVTQGYSGLSDVTGAITGVRDRFGMPEMLKVVCNNDTATNVTLQSPGTNLLTTALAGKFMLAVYLENQPGYAAPVPLTLAAAPAQGATSATLAAAWTGATKSTYTVQMGGTGEVKTATLTNGSTAVTWSGGLTYAGATTAASVTPAVGGSLNFEVTTINGSYSNALTVGFNMNQLREGWNFLKFCMRDALAYQSTNPTKEYHPFGISAGCYGTGAGANIKDNPVAGIRIATQNLSGATLYFSSIWTGWDHQAQLVLGCDAAGNDLVQYGLAKFQQYGFVGYVAAAAQIWDPTKSKIKVDLSQARPNNLTRMYDAGWEIVNHSANHIQNGLLMTAAAVNYEIQAVQPMYSQLGTVRGNQFYASPQSSSSRLSDAVIKNVGILAQRHARKSNVTVSPAGVDNVHHLGAIDIGNASAGGLAWSQGTAAGADAGWQKFSKIDRYFDVLEAYGDTGFPFWHGITTLGDTGSGEDLTGDNLLITLSAFNKVMDSIARRDAAGTLRVRDGISGFYYGTGR